MLNVNIDHFRNGISVVGIWNPNFERVLMEVSQQKSLLVLSRKSNFFLSLAKCFFPFFPDCFVVYRFLIWLQHFFTQVEFCRILFIVLKRKIKTKLKHLLSVAAFFQMIFQNYISRSIFPSLFL